jgi:hypothetical protein
MILAKHNAAALADDRRRDARTKAERGQGDCDDR